MYFNYLLDQYRKATGCVIDVNSKDFLNDFKNWLSDMQKKGKTYISFLEDLGLKVDSYFIAEVGKGKSDTIVRDLETTIITPYPEGIDRDGFNYSRLIMANFKIYDGIPTLLMRDGHGNKILDTLSPSMFNCFMTQNPYSPKHMMYWDEIHNRGEKEIIMGMFGSIYDKDADDKVKELKEFKDKLVGSYNEDYMVENDTYCYVVASDKVEKKLFKRKSR